GPAVPPSRHGPPPLPADLASWGAGRGDRSRGAAGGAKPRLGLLLTGSPSDQTQSRELNTFTKKIGELGWVDGRTITLDVRWADASDHVSTLAAELVRTGVDLFVTPGPAATDAARWATSTIPIVMIAGTDPRLMGAASGQDPQEGQARRLTHGEAHQVRPRHHPQFRQVARPHDPAVAPSASGPRHRVMDRRRLLLTSLAGVVAAPIVAEAQKSEKMARVGILGLGPVPSPQALATSVSTNPFWISMSQLGWIDGQNMIVERRFGESADQLRRGAADLVRLKVDVLFVSSTGLSKILQMETKTIPIVIGRADENLVAAGLVSLASP